MVKYIALYGPSSVNVIVDFVKSMYVFEDVVPVIVKPFGAGAQIGVPEAYKYSYRVSKPLVILPELSDVVEVLKPHRLLYYSSIGGEVDPEVLRDMDNYVMVFSGEMELSKKELMSVEPVLLKGVPRELPVLSLATLVVYLITRRSS